MSYYFYILYNPVIDKYYSGQTSNVENRLKFHNQKHKVKYTGKQISAWQLVYTETYPTRSEAVLREKAVKSKKSRKYILKLIEQSRL
jgi:putative endonuclease